MLHRIRTLGLGLLFVLGCFCLIYLLLIAHTTPMP